MHALCLSIATDEKAFVCMGYGNAYASGAEVGYNPHKLGRPFHAYHAYWVGNLRLLLDVDEAIHLGFDRACKRAGIKNFHFHDLRHETTSRRFEKGLNLMQVSSIIGHKTLQMLKRYTHLG